jgi:hypothetical protein
LRFYPEFVSDRKKRLSSKRRKRKRERDGQR